MLPLEHSAILSTSNKLPFSIKTLVLSIFKWLLKTGFTVPIQYDEHLCKIMLNLDQWLRFCLKVYSIFSSGGHFI